MRQRLGPAALSLLLALPGCGLLIDHHRKQLAQISTADPLTLPSPSEASKLQPGAQVDYLASVVQQSMTNCRKLLTNTGLITRAIDTDMDAITTVLTALGTAFTPVATIHALTAAASISSGFKGALNSDVYGRQAASIISTEISSTYFTKIHLYVLDLETRIQKQSQIITAIELMRINLIHQECDIDKAIGDLNAKARTGSPNPQPAKPAITADDIKPGFTFKTPDGTAWTVLSVNGTIATAQKINTATRQTFAPDSILIFVNGSL